MANRVLSERIKTSPTLAKCSFEAASAFLWALTEADPLGRMQDSPDAIAYALFAQRPDIDTLRKKMVGWVSEWAAAGLVQRYEIGGRRCIQILKWAEYQRIHDGAKSKYPNPPEVTESSGNLPEDAVSCRSDSVLDSDSDSDLVSDSSARKARAKKTRCPETIDFTDGMIDYAKEHRLDIDQEWTKCRDHHQFKGTLGIDWQKGFWTWLRNAVVFAKNTESDTTPPPDGYVYADTDVSRRGFRR